MSKPILELHNVSFKYDDEYVLQNIELQIPAGAFLAVVGPNGSGKSTMLKLMLKLLKPTEGQITVFGEPIESFKQWQQIGYVSQKANSFNSGFPATVYEVVQSGLTAKKGLFRFFNKQDDERVRDAIEAVGMSEFLGRNIGELSGGQQQRVFIARAIVSEPKLLILDEPTVGVDSKNSQTFYEMLGHLNEHYNMTLLLVTHDIGTVSDKVTHVACLNKHLHFHGPSDHFDQLDERTLSKIYGHELHVIHHHHGG